MSSSKHLEKAQFLMNSVKGLSLSVEERREKSIELASAILSEARLVQTRADYEQQRELERMMEDSKGKAFTVCMVDQCFRSQKYKKIANQLHFLIKTYGVPRYFGVSKRIQVGAFKWVGDSLASFMVPVIQGKMRKETAHLILSDEEKKRKKHFEMRRKESIRLNINHLGEAVLGEEEALTRLNIYLKELACKDVEYVSIKISTIYSQINLLSWEHTLEVLSNRLKILYREAKKHFYTRSDGTQVHKFVNLDMEEYRDLHITVELFKRVLEDPEFFDYSAGLVLQSYLPDAHLIQQQLTMWAMQRVAAGGAPIKVRIVKGANLCVEKVEASFRGWKQAPYTRKAEVDANFKRMIQYGLKQEHAKFVRIGVASHNLFDIAYALLLRIENKVEEYVGFEMLEGMAENIRQVIFKLTGSMLLYCPIASPNGFHNAIAYLMRRLDENTSKENFLHDIFGLNPGSVAWQRQVDQFSFACHAQDVVPMVPRRSQNRALKIEEIKNGHLFVNESDTDFSLSWNRVWGDALLLNALNKSINPVVSVINGEKLKSGRIKEGVNPSDPKNSPYQIDLADESMIEKALECGSSSFLFFKEMELQERIKLLRNIAYVFRKRRSQFIEAMIIDAGKTVMEADVEVSEAIDFAEYYSHTIENVFKDPDLHYTSRGLTLIASPWNFPLAIPAGGILAALVTGNSVIFKPPLEAAYVGFELVQAFWEAGVSKNVLQFVVCEDAKEGSLLICDPRVKQVVLTGETKTAKAFYQMRPDLHLLAETGGKNAIIVTSLADRDLAIRDIVQSAFGHAGQKCSACSLLVLEEEVYNDKLFKQQLLDATQSLYVGASTDLASKVPPLIHPPSGKLLKALTTLNEGETFLLEPKNIGDNPHLYTPGIKWGVQEGSDTHLEEFFGPLLGVICAKNLEHAVDIVNQTRYGLTSGLHSLDTREHAYFQEHIEAGNYYINRGITGAIVQRQPFGGCKESQFGASLKAGGPNYLYAFMQSEEIPFARESLYEIDPSIRLFYTKTKEWLTSSEDQKLYEESLSSYSYYKNEVFNKKEDFSKILGQDNIFGYRAKKQLVLRIEQEDRPIDIYRAIAAALLVEAPIKLSFSLDVDQSFQDRLKPYLTSHIEVIVEDEISWMAHIKSGSIYYLRVLSSKDNEYFQECLNSGVHLLQETVSASGRIELMVFLREYALSYDYHRYGNLGLRENEARSYTV